MCLLGPSTGRSSSMPRVLVHTRRAVEAYKSFGFKQEGLGLCPSRCATRCSPWRRSSRIRRGARVRGRARSRKAGPLKRPSYRKKRSRQLTKRKLLPRASRIRSFPNVPRPWASAAANGGLPQTQRSLLIRKDAAEKENKKKKRELRPTSAGCHKHRASCS